jgi:hypothetical protein
VSRPDAVCKPERLKPLTSSHSFGTPDKLRKNVQDEPGAHLRLLHFQSLSGTSKILPFPFVMNPEFFRSL